MHRCLPTAGLCRGHTLMEMVAAMVVSTILLAGLAAVTFIASQTAYTPTAAIDRTEAADVVNQISEELRYATLVIQQTPRILEFVVTDRDADGAAEKIRYEWSGTLGDPLIRTLNAGSAVVVLDAVNDFSTTYEFRSKITSLKTTVDSAEQALVSNTFVQSGTDREITPTYHVAQYFHPTSFSGVPANALYWNATRVRFYGSSAGNDTDKLHVELRPAGTTTGGPTSYVLGRVVKPKTQTPSWGNMGMHDAVFLEPVRGLSLSRPYSFVWSNGTSNVVAKLRMTFSMSSPYGVFESTDSPAAGASWHYAMNGSNYALIYGVIYGTYTTPGPTRDVTRNYISHARLILQAGDETHSRIDTSVPLAGMPESVSAYWRTDFDGDPTATNANGDAVVDWSVAGGGSFNAASVAGGVWYASGVLQTEPASDFVSTTIVDVRCRNTSLGGNGAVIRINADRQSGLHAPLLVYVQRRSDGSQTLTLSGKSSDAATVQLCSRQNLSTDFIRFQLMIVPQYDLVNLQINGEDQGTYTYRTYTPTASNNRFLSAYADGSSAEFDHVEVRVTN